MKINKFALVIGFAIASVLFLEVAAHADERNRSTQLTFSTPIEIPGHVLPAGTYQFKLADEDDLDVVQIFNADGTRLYASLQTIATERREPTGDTVLVMAEQGTERPEALLKWFYPGHTTGNEFVYSKHEEQQLAQDRQHTILAKETAEAGD
jgi:hypothetical protein